MIYNKYKRPDDDDDDDDYLGKQTLSCLVAYWLPKIKNIITKLGAILCMQKHFPPKKLRDELRELLCCMLLLKAFFTINSAMKTR